MKEANEIFSTMLKVFQERTGIDMSGSADLAVRLYAAAAQLESLYGYCDWALRQSFPQTATGEHLDKHAAMRLLSRKASKKATGKVTFYLAEALGTDVIIPAGTVVTTGALVRFYTVEEGIIAAGYTSAEVLTEAEEAGSHGNVAAGTVTKMPQMPVSVVRCENIAAFSGGTDEETDEALRARILESYKRLPNGANAAFYEQCVLEHPQVRSAYVLPKRRGVGTVDVVVVSTEGIPSEELLQELQNKLDAARELAVDVQVMAADAVHLAVHMSVWPRDGVTEEEAAQAARQAVEQMFAEATMGSPLYLAELGSRIYATGKVKNYIITQPETDVYFHETQLPVLAELTVTEGE